MQRLRSRVFVGFCVGAKRKSRQRPDKRRHPHFHGDKLLPLLRMYSGKKPMGAYTVGLKQAILFPFVTRGSLIIFYDVSRRTTPVTRIK